MSCESQCEWSQKRPKPLTRQTHQHSPKDGTHVQTPALLAVSAHALHRAGVDHQRDAGRGHDDRGQQRDGGLHHEMQNRIHGILSDVVVRGPQPRRHARRRRGTWSRSARWRRHDRGHDAHGRRAGDAQLPVRRQLDHAAGAADRHRRDDAEPGERFQQVSAASGEPRADELRAARRRLRHARPPGAARTRPSAQQMADGRLGASPRTMAKLRSHRGRRRSGPRPNAAAAASRRRERSRSGRRSVRGTIAASADEPENASSIRPRSSTPGIVLGIAMASYRDSATARTVSSSCPATT